MKVALNAAHWLGLGFRAASFYPYSYEMKFGLREQSCSVGVVAIVGVCVCVSSSASGRFAAGVCLGSRISGNRL